MPVIFGELSDIMWLIFGVLLILGAIECFAGFKILKIMIFLWDFFVGAMLGVIVGVVFENVVIGWLIAMILGTALSLFSFRLYKAGVFIIAAVMSFTAIFLFTGIWAIGAVLAIIVGISAVFFTKSVIIVTTAAAGAGVILSSAFSIAGLGSEMGLIMTCVFGIPVAILGVCVQHITTKCGYATKKYKVGGTSIIERKYPGKQIAYRIYCINCGKKLSDNRAYCSFCGYRYLK